MSPNNDLVVTWSSPGSCGTVSCPRRTGRGQDQGWTAPVLNRQVQGTVQCPGTQGAGTTYFLIGVEFSKSKPDKHYRVIRATTAEHEWMSCDCPAFTVSKGNQGKKQWERSCRHTEKYSLCNNASISQKTVAVQV